ncbi:MAG: glycosyl hydrolase-related protein [Spirochaetaceae bacterium]|jgi:alpha-mannosidase|nr:glycosyl hydrolase-related protein [Spirochaetaceae bacterium]
MIRINTNHGQLAALWEHIKNGEGNPHFRRIYAELRYLCAISDSRGGAWDGLLRKAAEDLAAGIHAAGAVTPGAVKTIEDSLSGLSADAKEYAFLCVAHAHIDMNWMWGYHETAAVTLATMSAMLDMMDEFPDFTFSQSQASVYRILEEFAPELLERIKQRVREGRWELLASTWVECDKNMPSGESLTRHILYTKEYLSKTFGIAPEELVIDFEPDTFGHSRNVPEICRSGGVQYYYHCRGHVGEKVLYRWKAPSGSDIIVYTEPFWYNSDIDTFTADYAPELARLTGSRTLLKVYGVGDHGGGPTRRDITRLMEMNSWPLYPRFNFGRMKDYFDRTAERKESLPELDDEINFVCDGCYTTQTRIKAGNRKAERLMREAEFYAGAAMVYTGREYPGGLLAEAWRKLLFNQFHDIIPGSGVTETREYASGLYQQIFAAAESVRTLALTAIAEGINAAPLFKGPGITPGENPRAAFSESRGEGAGAGYGQTGRGIGRERIYHLFNPLPFDRRELGAITVWDYEGDFSQVTARDHAGKPLPSQAGESGLYWGHHFNTLLVDVSVPACGYTSVVIDEEPCYSPQTFFINDMRSQSPDRFILENECIRVVLNPRDGSIESFIDKAGGTELAHPQGGFGIFRLAMEDVRQDVTNWLPGMSAWFVGRYKEIRAITGGFEISPVSADAGQNGDLYKQSGTPLLNRKILRTAYKLRTTFGAAKGAAKGDASVLEAVVSLDAGSGLLRYDVTCDWREFGSAETGIPNLHFYLPLNYPGKFHFDVPFGITERAPRDMDLPAENFVLAENPGSPVSLALLSLDKYGFRCREDSMALTLIRGSYEPDLTPETGRHRISFAIAPVPAASADNLVRESLAYGHPFTVISGKPGKGAAGPARAEGLAVQDSLLRLRGDSAAGIVLSAVKRPEAGGNRLLLRVYESAGRDGAAVFQLGFTAKAAYFTDATEGARLGACTLEDKGRTLSFPVPAYSVRAVIVERA